MGDINTGRERLVTLLHEAMQGKPFNELYTVTFDHRAAGMIGDSILDALQAAGFPPDGIDMVGALTPAAVPLVDAVIHAAGARGVGIDGFVMDFVYPSVKGPSIAHRRVVLLDAWLSEKSYVQTSSLVTLRNGNELSLDFSVVRQQDAEVLAIASLVGGLPDAGASRPCLEVVDTLDGQSRRIPFVPVFQESEVLKSEIQESGIRGGTDARKTRREVGGARS